MAVEFVSGTVTLSAGASGSITLKFPRSGDIIEFMVYSTGRVEITRIEQEGVADYLTGVMELDHFKKLGNVYPLPEPIPYTKGTAFTFSLKDISGASNVVYIGLVIKY